MTYKLPKTYTMHSTSAVVPMTETENLALQTATPDYGMRPNGITIEDMRENAEFYKMQDDIDRVSVAQTESKKLAADVRKAARELQKFSKQFQTTNKH